MNDTPDRTGPRPDLSQGAQQRTPDLGQLTRADLARMSPQEIAAAHDAGRCDDLLSGRQA